jgi:hypothetical protein
MTTAKEIVQKVKVLNVGNSKPPQWDGKKAMVNSCGRSSSMLM